MLICGYPSNIFFLGTDKTQTTFWVKKKNTSKIYFKLVKICTFDESVEAPKSTGFMTEQVSHVSFVYFIRTCSKLCIREWQGRGTEGRHSSTHWTRIALTGRRQCACIVASMMGTYNPPRNSRHISTVRCEAQLETWVRACAMDPARSVWVLCTVLTLLQR